MANDVLLEDVEEIRQASAAVTRLSEEFDKLRVVLKGNIENELNTACAGDVANEFTKYYNEKIDTALIQEKDRLDLVATTLNASAGVLEGAETAVKSAF